MRLFVGIDWGRPRHQVCVVDARGELVCEEVVEQSGPNWLSWAEQLRARAGGEPIRVALERKEGALVDMLLGLGLEVYELNPAQTDALRRVECSSGAKDDRRDALVIARALARQPTIFRRVEGRSDEMYELRALLALDEQLTRDITRARNRVTAILADCLPDLAKLVDLNTRWTRQLLARVAGCRRPERPAGCGSIDGCGVARAEGRRCELQVLGGSPTAMAREERRLGRGPGGHWS